MLPGLFVCLLSKKFLPCCSCPPRRPSLFYRFASTVTNQKGNTSIPYNQSADYRLTLDEVALALVFCLKAVRIDPGAGPLYRERL